MNDANVIDISSTIIPKSDQLNADQLLAGDLTITVTGVSIGGGDDQPVSIHYEGDKGRPYKPCKTMRKLLAYAWGANAATWSGRAMTLFHEPTVKFGGEQVGGIRISHLSDIQGDIKVSLTSTKGKKALTSVKRMNRPTTVDHVGLIKAAATMEELEAAFKAAWVSTKDKDLRATFTEAKDARKAALTQQDQPDSFTLGDALQMVEVGDLTGAQEVATCLNEADAATVRDAIEAARK